jgi:hypothetical protein
MTRYKSSLGHMNHTDSARRTDFDLEDARFVAQRFGITREQVRAAAEAALAASPQDTALFLFRKSVDLFCQSLPAAKS